VALITGGPQRILAVLKSKLRDVVLDCPPAYAMYSRLKAFLLLKEYRERRERYHAICVRQGLSYREGEVAPQVQEYMTARGYKPPLKEFGDIHTFAIIPRLGWHEHLYDDLYELGLVTEFDYVKEGYDWNEFIRADRQSRKRRQEMNASVLRVILTAHKQRSIDWVFVYATGLEIRADIVRSIQEAIGVPVVCMCLDDKQSWVGPWMGDHRGGQVDIAAVFDLCWTSARIACEWYLTEGGRPLYMPEGCNANVYRPHAMRQDIAVSFIGAGYGFRKKTVRFARRYGIPIETFGPGWHTRSVWGQEAVELICRSRINLGMGGIGYSEWLTNVKTRDFEIPCTGGGLYLTSYNPDLAMHFDIGREIVCYRTNDEMVELIRYYLAHPDEAQEIAQQGRARCLRDHRWLHRYVKICKVLGILK
jgi:spore maturation protein CgeB